MCIALKLVFFKIHNIKKNCYILNIQERQWQRWGGWGDLFWRAPVYYKLTGITRLVVHGTLGTSAGTILTKSVSTFDVNDGIPVQLSAHWTQKVRGQFVHQQYRFRLAVICIRSHVRTPDFYLYLETKILLTFAFHLVRSLLK